MQDESGNFVLSVQLIVQRAIYLLLDGDAAGPAELILGDVLPELPQGRADRVGPAVRAAEALRRPLRARDPGRGAPLDTTTVPR